MKKIVAQFCLCVLMLLSLTIRAQVPGTLTSAVDGPSSVCPGTAKTYSAKGTGTYSWASSVGAIVGNSIGAAVSIQFPTTEFINEKVCMYDLKNRQPGAAPTSTCISVSSVPVVKLGAITGPTTAVCGLSNIGYKVPTDPNILSYMWTVPKGATITGGQGSNFVSVDFSKGYSPGVITVMATSACGNTKASLVVSGTPPMPVISPAGPYRSGDENTYSVSSPGAGSYFWNISSSKEFIVHDHDSAQVFITWKGSGTVQARNGCGLSEPLILNVSDVDPR